MYDTIHMRLSSYDMHGVDFLSEIPCYLDAYEERRPSNGGTYIKGSVGGLLVTINRELLTIKGSLCKYYLGDNFQTLERADTKRAIEQLSNTLHIPLDEAIITRLDLAQTFEMQHPPELYLPHLGEYSRFNRLVQPHSLYYTTEAKKLILYDKAREAKDKGTTIPDSYKGKYLLRYEQRYTERLATSLKVDRVTAAMLSDEQFYNYLVKEWVAAYRRIKKLNEITMNMDDVKGRKELDLLGRLALIERMGGELEALAKIQERYKMGELTRKQASSMKQAIKEASRCSKLGVTASPLIGELDSKIDEVAETANNL